MLLYSKSKKEIYDDKIHTEERIAKDALPISKEEHLELLKPKITIIKLSDEEKETQRQERLIQNEIRKMAIERLKKKGDI